MLDSGLRGRADSITESCAATAQTTGRSLSSSIIKTEGLLMHWWGFGGLRRELWLCGSFICFARLQSLCSRPTEQEIESLRAVHLWALLTYQSQFGSDKPFLIERVPLYVCNRQVVLHSLLFFSLSALSCRSPFTCPLSPRPSYGIEEFTVTLWVS